MSDTGKKSFIITLKDHASIDQFKKYVTGLGAVVKHEYNLIRGVAIEVPSNHVGTLEKHEDIATIEPDSEVKIN